MPRLPPWRLPLGVRAIFRALLPIAERDEVLSELTAEFQRRAVSEGETAARRWAWRQALGSTPALLRRGWWRGMTGFEPHANRLRPGGPMYESWIMDVRYAVRRLMRRPVYAALAIATLALGAGGTAAVYSVAETILLDPLPIAKEEQVGVLWFSGSWREQEFLRLRPTFPGFQRMAAYRPDDLTLEFAGQPLRLIPGIAVSTELFDVLGRSAMLGRTFRQGEDLVGAEMVAVLSYSLWQELGSDPNIVGKPLQLGGVARTVVGVMPQGFWFPSPATRVWTAAQMNPDNRSGRYTLVGRVAEGQTIAHMDGPLRALANLLAANFSYPNPQWDKTRNPSIASARESFVGDVKPALLATLTAMAVILLIACANVAALMLGQVDASANEIGVRAALGATRQRLIQQLLAESLLLGASAGAIGAVLAVAGFNVLLQALPLGVLAETARLDWRVFWTSMTAAFAASVLVATVPGVVLWRGGNLQSVLATTRTGGVGTRGGALESTLVVGQIALAVLLAAGAGLLIRSVVNLRAIDPGVGVDGAVVVDTTMPARLRMPERQLAVETALSALRALPGVQSAGAAQKLPLRGSGDNWNLSVRGRGDLNASTAMRFVTHDYFSVMGMRVRRGRNFSSSDRAGNERVVIVNEALAAKFFPHEDPIGQVLQTMDAGGERIIGVVSNAAEATLVDGPVPARYVLYPQMPFVYTQVSIVLRTTDPGNLAALVQAARQTIERESRHLAVQQATTLRNIFDLAVGPVGQVVTLVTVLTVLALVLGAVGVYGVISHFVQRRSREYGIRLALGQSPARVVGQVLTRGAALVALGSAIGAAAALAMASVLASMLYGVQTNDPRSMAGAVGVLFIVGMLAAFVPARRASLTDPATVLRQS
jgi:putative ABC transport system permease protein